MKYIIIIIVFLSSLHSYSQNINGIVLNNSEEPIQHVKIYTSKNDSILTDKNGMFSIDYKKISKYLSFEKYKFVTKNVHLSDIDKSKTLKIYLDSLSELEPVYFQVKKRKLKNYTLGLSNKGIMKRTPIFGFESCVLFKNEYRRKGIITYIKIPLRKTKKTKYVGNIQINFYEYDSIRKKPGGKIDTPKIIIDCKNQKYTETINIESYNIAFPKNGICIGLQFVPKNEKDIEFKKDIGPSLSGTKITDEVYTWSRFKNSTWSNAVKTPWGLFNTLLKIKVKL